MPDYGKAASILGGEELETLLTAYECGNEGLAEEARANIANVLDLNFMEPVNGWEFYHARAGCAFYEKRPYWAAYVDPSFGKEFEKVSKKKWLVPDWLCIDLKEGGPALCVPQSLRRVGEYGEVSWHGVVLVRADGRRTSYSWYSEGHYLDEFVKSASVLPRCGVRAFAESLLAAVGGRYALKTANGKWLAYSTRYKMYVAPIPFLVNDPLGATWFDSREQAAKFARLTYAVKASYWSSDIVSGDQMKFYDIDVEPAGVLSTRLMPGKGKN